MVQEKKSWKRTRVNSTPKDKTSKTMGKSTEGSKSHHKSVGEYAQGKEPIHTAKDLEEPAHQEFKIGGTEDQPDEETTQLPERVEDLQLGVESYQKKLNLTKPDTYRSNLKRREAYTVYSNPRGFIYQNKDKKNRLMRIDELHKFSDGTLNDVRTALDDRLKGG
nr:hypothetical protein [Tanacetum cinerariifolium]